MMLLIDEVESLQELSSLDIESLYMATFNNNGRLFRMDEHFGTYVLAYYYEQTKRYCVVVTQPIHWEILANAERQKRISNLIYLSVDLIRGVLRNG